MMPKTLLSGLDNKSFKILHIADLKQNPSASLPVLCICNAKETILQGAHLRRSTLTILIMHT